MARLDLVLDARHHRPMDTRPSADASPMGSVVLGESHGTTSVDPLGEADPVEAARVVRRALAAADRKAFDVRRLVVVRDARPDAAAMARFARRALGPHGSTVPTA